MTCFAATDPAARRPSIARVGARRRSTVGKDGAPPLRGPRDRLAFGIVAANPYLEGGGITARQFVASTRRTRSNRADFLGVMKRLARSAANFVGRNYNRACELLVVSRLASISPSSSIALTLLIVGRPPNSTDAVPYRGDQVCYRPPVMFIPAAVIAPSLIAAVTPAPPINNSPPTTTGVGRAGLNRDHFHRGVGMGAPM